MQNVSATGSVDSKRIRLHLTLAVNRVNWSPSAAPGAESGTTAGAPNTAATATATVEVSGRVAEENPHVKLGAFHTLEIEVNKDVRIEKDADGWDSVALGRVEESCVPGRGAEVAAIVCGEGMKCQMSRTRSELSWLFASRFRDVLSIVGTHDCSTPTARRANTTQDFYNILRTREGITHLRSVLAQVDMLMQGLTRFYQSLYTSFLRHVPYSAPSLRAIVIASPGWVRDAVFDYIMAEASRTSNKPLLAARNKFIKVHVNSPHVHSLVEALKSPEVGST